MKNITTFIIGAIFGGFVVYIYFFLFSKEWREKRRIETWNRRIKEARMADTSNTYRYNSAQ